MRLVADDLEDRGCWKVFVDDKEIKYVVVADDVEGWAECFSKLPNGEFEIVFRGNGPEVNRVRYYGKVLFEKIEGNQP